MQNDLSAYLDICHLRDAGAVQRFHTNRVKAQSLADHSFGVAMLLDYVWPTARKELIMAAMFHDLPELVTGDMPAPVKRAVPQMAVLLEEMEKSDGRLYRDFRLTVYEEAVLKWCDTMELVLYCFEQVQAGNTYAIDPLAKGLGWVRCYDMANDPSMIAGLRCVRIYNGVLAAVRIAGFTKVPEDINLGGYTYE